MERPIRIEGIEELVRQLGDLGKLDASDAVEDATDEVHRAVESEAPVDTGNLSDAVVKRIYKRRGGSAWGVVAVDGKIAEPSNLGAIIEFGTIHQAGNPFMSRGFKKSRGNAQRKLEAGLRKAIDKAL